MNLTNSQEEYLKAVYILEKNNKKVRVTDIATKMKITKPSVNRAIKVLKNMNLLEYETYGDIVLTDEGKTLAKEIIKRQDILKMFLVDVLEVDETNAEEEAKLMKHAMSKDTTKKLEQYIGKWMDLGDLNCDYDKENPKCQTCIRTRKATPNKSLKIS